MTANGVVNFQPNSLLGSGYLPRVLDSLTIGVGGRVLLTPSAIAANRTVLFTPGLTIANASTGTGPGGQLDVGTNDVVIQGPDPTVILPLVTAGYNAGSFTGQGITSSAAAANVKRNTTVGAILNADNNGNAVYGSTFDGQGVSPFDVLIKYTYFGDANLDGQVNGQDYALIDAGFLSQKTATKLTGWYNGDFNYDGKIDASDYTLIDNAFNTQGTRLSSSATPSITAASTDEVAPAVGTAAVPEPADRRPDARRRRDAARPPPPHRVTRPVFGQPLAPPADPAGRCFSPPSAVSLHRPLGPRRRGEQGVGRVGPPVGDDVADGVGVAGRPFSSAQTSTCLMRLAPRQTLW